MYRLKQLCMINTLFFPICWLFVSLHGSLYLFALFSSCDISSLNAQKYLYAFGVILRKTKLKFDEQ